MIKDIPTKDFVPQLSSFVRKSMDKNGWSLQCEDLVLETSEVAGPEGLLPLLMWVTSNTMAKIWGEQDLAFRLNSDALCGVTLECNAPLLPASVWLHAIHYQLEEAVHSPDVGAVMNTWFDEWNNALSKKTIKLFPPKISAPSTNV